MALLMPLPLLADTTEPAVTTANNGNLVMSGIPEIPKRIAEDLNRYQNVRSAAFVEWSQDGQSVFVSTRFGEVNQLHRVSSPGGARYQLTFFDEPISGISRQPGGSRMTFTMDAGGNEFSQIFTLDPSDGSSTMISDGESRNGAVLWNHAGNRIAFQSTRRNGASNDVWTMDPSQPESASVALESPDGSWWGPSAYSPDDARLLVANYISVTDSNVLVVDLETGAQTVIAGGGETPSVNLPYDFDPSGTGVFYVSDANSEFSRLTHVALTEGASPTVITADIPWNVTDFALSEDGKRAMFGVNAGGLTELYLMDPATFKYRRIDNLPVGLSGGAQFSPDASTLALTLNTANSPSDTFVLDLKDDVLAHGDLTRWTYSEVGGLNTDLFVTPSLIEYPTFDEVDGKPRMIPAFVYRPMVKNMGKKPVIISIHGGPEGQARPAFNSTYQMWVQKLGATVIVPNVRGSSGYGKTYVSLDNGFKREDSVRDIGSLLDWIATQPDLDADRVAVIGGSYGGYMVLACAVHYSDRINAVVDIVGISSFVTFLENTQDYRRDLRRVEYGDERNPAMRAHLEKISPLNNVAKIDVPMFVVQGQNDPRVPVTEAEQIVEALRSQGQSVWYMNALNEGHGYRRKENRDLYQQAVVMFFETHLLDRPSDPAAP